MSRPVEIFDDKAEELVSPEARLEYLSSGFSWAEGPVWDFEAGYLTFSDVIGNTMHRYDDSGGVRIYRSPSNHSNGQTIDGTGRLITCEHQTRRVTRETTDGIETLVDSYEGKMFNSPNDVVAARDGSLIFTDPAYGLDKVEEGGGGERELSFQGVYRISPDSNEAELLVEDFVGPNGLALSPEEDILYVADSERSHVRSFEIGAGWELSGGGVLAEIPSEGDEVPDGMKVDVEGNIYCTGKGGVWILSPGGAMLGHIQVPETTANLAWGDEDARTMYITADTSLYRIRCRAVGYAPHQ
jgi:gluconolactonase